MVNKKSKKKIIDDLNFRMDHWKELILKNELPNPAVVSIIRSDISIFKASHRTFFKKRCFK